jgi:hypothetical protein
MNHPTKHEIRTASLNINDYQKINRWFEALTKEERDSIRAFLNSIPDVKATSSGIGKYWKVTVQGKSNVTSQS